MIREYKLTLISTASPLVMSGISTGGAFFASSRSWLIRLEALIMVDRCTEKKEKNNDNTKKTPQHQS